MKVLAIFILLQLWNLSIISGQDHSIDFIYRDWYLNGLADKNFKIGDTIIFDTMKLDPKINHDFLKWEFKINGDFINLSVFIMSDGKFKGEWVAMSDDDLNWEVNNTAGDLIIDYGIIEGYGEYKAKYKIIELSKSKLMLIKLNSMQ